MSKVPDAAKAFLDQNTVFARDLTEDDRATVGLYAQHHAGGLFVLWRELEGTLNVKAHDDWGGDTEAVVHVYDSEDPDVSMVSFFTSGHEALAEFLAATPERAQGWDE